jgi:hypothetical protein
MKSNKGISIENMIEYLDYVNKVRYSQEEVKSFLDELQKENKIYFKNKLWFAQP